MRVMVRDGMSRYLNDTNVEPFDWNLEGKTWETFFKNRSDKIPVFFAPIFSSRPVA